MNEKKVKEVNRSWRSLARFALVKEREREKSRATFAVLLPHSILYQLILSFSAYQLHTHRHTHIHTFCTDAAL